jgi:hypothetical protein
VAKLRGKSVAEVLPPRAQPVVAAVASEPEADA